MKDYAFYLPDFFDDNAFAHPEYIQPFQKFNLGMTRRSARNVDTKIPGDLMLEFARSAPRLGLSIDTIAAIAEQIISERGNPRLRIRRRYLQGLIMGDVFLSLMKTRRPDFATFYTNHVAAAMHRYWAAAFPGDYENEAMPKAWVSDYGGEISEAMRVVDKMLAKFKRYCDSTGTKLVIATSMGQGPIPHRETKGFVSITDIGQFMTALGFDASQYRERYAMVPCGGVVMQGDLAATLAQRLDQTSVDGAYFVRSDDVQGPLNYGLYDEGFVSLFSSFDSYTGKREVQIGNRTVSFEEAGFGTKEHEDNVECTAQHTKDGALLVYDPASRIGDESRRYSASTAIAPAILDYFGVPIPGYMQDRDDFVSETLGRHSNRTRAISALA